MSKFIKKITIEKLFGYYTYKIEKNNLIDQDNPLLIIYGENGGGKTTILELLFYLLSTADNAGHKTNISKVKFKKFSVLLDNNVIIEAYRENDTLIGSYTLAVHDENAKNIHKVFLKVNEENVINILEDDIEEKFEAFMNYMRKLNTSIHYLSDKRKLLAGIDDIINMRSNINRKISRQELERIKFDGLMDEGENELKISVKQLENWIRQHVLQASKSGDKNINTIYTDLIKKVSSTKKQINIDDLKNLAKNLELIGKENTAYEKNGFVSRIDTKEIEELLLISSKDNYSLIYNIVEPYVNGLHSRLDALKDIQEIINLFLTSINEYFSHKTIKYTMNKGFSISYKDNSSSPIELHMLSSGEKQLLLLFCNVITSSDEASIFIIDEPEISLNVKWQRKLIKTLLEFTKKRHVQFIIASHSIEVLAGHKESICKLTNLKKN